MGWVYAIVALFVIGAGTAGVLTYNHAITGKVEAEHAAAAWKVSAEEKDASQKRTQRDFDLSEEISRKRGQELVASNARLASLGQTLAALAAGNPVAGSYLSGRVDADVRRLRRTSAGCVPDLDVPCPDIKPGADGGASDGRRDQPRPDSGELPSTGGAAPGKR